MSAPPRWCQETAQALYDQLVFRIAAAQRNGAEPSTGDVFNVVYGLFIEAWARSVPPDHDGALWKEFVESFPMAVRATRERLLAQVPLRADAPAPEAEVRQ